jgi:RNA polymerase sigma-70 factor (ECF subfamily)
MTSASARGLPSPTGEGRRPLAEDSSMVAFEAFVSYAQPRLSRIANRWVSSYLAEDLVAETFEVMYMKWREVLTLDATPMSYAYGVLRNKLAGAWRTKSREILQESDELLDVLGTEVEESAEQTAVRNLQIATLNASIKSALTEREQQVVLLHYVQSFSASQIADLLSITPGTVRSTLRLSRRKLERSMRHSSTVADS